MQPSFIDYILVIFGAYYLYGVTFKPEFFWQRGRIRRTREVIGDQNTARMYLVVAVIMLAVGLIGMFGLL
ncbi:MAG: hypothetical protein H6662_20450 [Ardenticatenaceae bacterium]|nr:hypothetical protein [Ardenticatenaceae bacterium]MCB8990156.1 hypothetical protein [Ardenticatenaceae bacterium]